MRDDGGRMTRPTAGEAWKPTPIAAPSKKLCADSVSAPTMPRACGSLRDRGRDRASP